MPCFPATIQAPVKSFLRPGIWLPGSRDYHCQLESWRINAEPLDCMEEIVTAVSYLNEAEHPTEYYVNKVDYSEKVVEIYCYTQAGWLDVLEIKFVSIEEHVTMGDVFCFSTGALPAWLPLGFICDMVLCWCPFSDQGSNKMRCKSVREAIPFHVDVVEFAENNKLLPSKKPELAKDK